MFNPTQLEALQDAKLNAGVFARSYIETALWSSVGDDGEPLDKDFVDSDIDPATLVAMVRDCEKFQAENAEALSTATPACSEYQAGNWFWLARNGHGSGFLDNDFRLPADQSNALKALQAAAKAFGEFDLYLGDDGLIHGTPL